MGNPKAVLVEDDREQGAVSVGLLQQAGFEVESFEAQQPALEYLEESPELIDLFVLDRRLPQRFGELASEEVGDALLDVIRNGFPDSRIIVFTGYASVRHVQTSVEGGGQLPTRNGVVADRITVLEKSQSIEFRRHLENFRALLQDLDDIELVAAPTGTPFKDIDRRCLRRLAFEYRAVSIAATPLGGGLTGAPVWMCEMRRKEGVAAFVVAKVSEKSPPRGGLSELLPIAAATATVTSVRGLMAGLHVNVLQVAGSDPVALMSLIGTDPSSAVAIAQGLLDLLASVPDRIETCSIAEACAELIDYENLVATLGRFGVSIPPGSLTASVQIGARHGDLHPGNVLVENGRAVLIDFDSGAYGPRALDLVTLFISTLVHPDSPLRGAGWPSANDIMDTVGTEHFGSGEQGEVWLGAAHTWAWTGRTSEREFWALVLAYSGRQLQYDDVVEDEAVLERVLALARRAAAELGTI